MSIVKQSETFPLSCVHVGTWYETLFFPGVPEMNKEAGKNRISCFRLVALSKLVTSPAKGNGASQRRVDTFDFSNFENSIFFIGRDLRKDQCVFV